MAARNEDILSHEDALEIVNAIVNTKENYQSKHNLVYWNNNYYYE